MDQVDTATVARSVVMSDHSIVLGVDRDTLTFNVICHVLDDPNRGCVVYYDDQKWPDEFTCRCKDMRCDCRLGDHGGCGEFEGYIENIGDSCRARVATDECWFVHAAEEVGIDQFSAFLSVAVPVELSGCSWDEPIEVCDARPKEDE